MKFRLGLLTFAEKAALVVIIAQQLQQVLMDIDLDPRVQDSSGGSSNPARTLNLACSILSQVIPE